MFSAPVKPTGGCLLPALSRVPQVSLLRPGKEADPCTKPGAARSAQFHRA